MSQAGAAKLVNCVRGMVNTRRDMVCIKIDLANAYNEISRTAIIDVLSFENSLSHLTGLAGAVLAPETELESVGKRWGRTGKVVVQGDPMSGDFFDIGLQPSLVQTSTSPVNLCRGLNKFQKTLSRQ